MRPLLCGVFLLLVGCAQREPIVVRDGFCAVPQTNRLLQLREAAPALPARLLDAGFTRDAVHLADVIGALEPLDVMLRAETERDNGLRAFMARQTVINHIALAHLELDAARAALQCEGERGDLLRARLDQIESDRSRNLTIAGIVIGAAFAGISGGLSLSGASNASDIAAIAGGVVGAGAAAALLYGDPSGRLTLNHTLLEEVRQQPDQPQHFPPRVWRYLTRALAPGRPTPAEQVLADWRSAGILPGAGEETSVVFLTDAQLTVADLQQRDAMLDQLRSRVALMSLGLRGLLEEVLARPAPGLRSSAAMARANAGAAR